MIKGSRFLIVYILLGITAIYILTHSDIAVPMNRPFADFPAAVSGWRMVSQSELSGDVLDVLKPTDYLSRVYESPDGRRVDLFLGYHGGGKGSRGIHSPKHCLPGSGWFEAATGKTSIEAGGENINLVRSVYRKGGESTLFLYWFQVRGRSLTDEYSLKLAEIWNSMTQRRRDSTFVRISMPCGADDRKAMVSATQFIKDFYPVIRDFLPK